MADAVRDVFIDFSEKNPGRASEVGEVLAYCIAASHLAAPQIAAKMSLKTSGNHPVYGLDGIHAKVEDGALIVYFLESKLNGSANQGAKEYAESIADFMTGKKKYLLEYSIVSDLGNLDTLDADAQAVAMDFFDVYGNPHLPRKERSVGVVCYSNSTLFDNLPPVSEGQGVAFHHDLVSQKYAASLPTLQESADKHLKSSGVDPNKCYVFFVAVPSVKTLREAFYEKLGKPKAASSPKEVTKKKKKGAP